MAGIEATIELEGRTISYDDIGSGPPIVFVHGVWASGGLWDRVVARLSANFRCIVPTLPLGVHRIASPAGIDKSPAALARTIVALLEKLDLRDAILVGNDTGGAICQLVVTSSPERIGRLVLTNCDALEVFPPRSLAPVYALARAPFLWWLFAQQFRLASMRRLFYRTIARTAPDAAVLKTLLLRFAKDAAVREDLRQTIRAIAPQVTLDAAKRFAGFDREVLLVWGTEDLFFPVSLARRLAAAFPRARLQLVPRSRLFVPVDAPGPLCEAIEAFIA